MRIISIGNFFNPSWDGSQPDEEHIAKALEDLGHEVTRQQRENYIIPDIDFDFILIAQWDGYGEMKLKHFKCPIVYWAFDYQADGQEWHERLIQQSDLYLSKRLTDAKYPNWKWLPQDFAPSFLDKYDPHRLAATGQSFKIIEKDIDVLFTGSYLPWATFRNETLEAVGNKYNLVIHSVNEWPQGNLPPVMDYELPELYARAKVILSIDHTIEAGYWSDRNAQIMACGGLVLFKYVPMSNFVFRDGLIYFNTIDECLDTIDKILNKADLQILDAIRLRGYQLAHRNLMVQHRVADLLIIMEDYLAHRSV